jgi:phage terminase large subunit-like protein
MRRILNHPLFSNRWIKQEQRFNFSVDQNTKDLVELAQGGYQLGLSPKTKVLGKGFSICVMDDIVDAQKAKPSDVDIQAAIEYIDNTLPNRSNTHDDCIVLVMQRLSEKDPTQHLIDSFSDYFLLNLPAEYNPDKTYFSPLGEKWNDPRKIPGEILNKRWSKEFIASEKSKVLYWQTRYNQDPVNPTGNKIKSKDLQFYLIPEDNKSFEIKTCVFDFTFGSIVGGVHASRTATIHLGYKNGNYYLQDALFGTYDPTGQRDMAIDRKKMYPDSYFVVEEKANGAAIMSMIRRLFSDRPHLLQPITPHLFGTKSKDKVERLESIEYVFTQQRFHILSGQSWTGDVLKELLGFPNYRTDDLVDCIVYGIFFIEQMLSGKSSTGVLSSNVPRVENYNDQIRDKMQNTARMSENYITIDIIPELVQDWIETERGVDRYDLISSATSRDAVRSLWD